MNPRHIITFGCLALLLYSCAYQNKTYYASSTQEWENARPGPDLDLVHSVFLLGDAGEPTEGKLEPNFKLLQSQVESVGKKGTFVMLGDNIYPRGMVDKEHPERKEAERRLSAQLDIVQNFEGNIAIIPGNHDWDRQGKNGQRNLKNQEKFVKKYTGRKDIFLPQEGCPGPVRLGLTDKLTLVLFDSQWWLHKYDKPHGLESECDVKTDEDFLLEMYDALEDEKHKHLLVVAHHPIYSHGPHGGRFTFKDHLFPLTAANDKFYLPLPIIGSIYPLYRSILGNVQDIPHPRNQELREGLLDIFDEHPNLVYANGHEHSLEYSTDDSLHFIVSGAGSKREPVGHSKRSEFTSPTVGFSRLDYYSNGEVWMSFWAPEGDGSKGKVIYRKKLYQKEVELPVSQESLMAKYPSLDFSDSTVTTIGSKQYEAKGLRAYLFGKNYRNVWAAPIEVPLFDLGTEKGGLKILKRGGGMQTKSLRMEAPDGRHYVLRSVEKYAEGAVPEVFRQTFAASLVQDQISASHPYGASVVAPLAEAVGVYHTNPKVVFIPDDPRFGSYQEVFANTLALYEERPADDWSNSSLFGSSSDIISTFKVLDKLEDDNDNRVDQDAVLRARLFDIVLGDWDRHDDQWRWASFEEEKGDVYQPIPRDRDQAFFRGEGPIMKLVSRKWAMPKFQPYDTELKNVAGFAFNARYFDRSFLNNQPWESWEAMADSIQARLTDEIIEQSIKENWPAEVYAITGEITIERMKGRRDGLKELARDLYLALAKTVEIVGSDKGEHFHIERQAEGKLSVTVSKRNKEGKIGKQLYQRVFLPDETKEIRLWGRGGEDEFHYSGEEKVNIRVRIIGGGSMDSVSDEEGKTRGKKARIYDLKSGISLGEGSWVSKTSNNYEVNEYERKSFKYNIAAPALYVGFNPDDGVFLGGGTLIQTHGFRKKPYSSQHLILANYAIKSKSFNIRYKGQFTDVIGKADLDLDLTAFIPQFNGPWFGLGNETTIDPEQPLRYYWLNLSAIRLLPGLKFDFLNDKANLTLAPMYQYVQANEDRNQERFIDNTEQNGLDSMTNALRYTSKSYAGGSVKFEYEEVDDRVFPTRGIHLELEATNFNSLNNNSGNFTRYKGELALYFNLNPINSSLATRFGVATNSGDWDYFQGNTVGLLTGLRGFRKNRFMGKGAMFWNVELRTRLGQIKNPVLPTALGLLFFYDQGKVWMKDDNPTRWHRSVGGGLWFTPFDVIAVSISYGLPISEEGAGDVGVFQFGVGFAF